MSDASTQHRTSSPERLIVFADAVVAIAITLLALDLPTPEGNTASDLWSSVRSEDAHYLAFITSFVTIALAWTQHHRIWRLAARSDFRQQWLTMGWLMTIVLVPFATKVIRTGGDQTLTAHALRFGFYALLQFVGYLSLVIVAKRMAALQMTHPDVTRADVDRAITPSLTVSLGFGLSIPLFFATTYGWIAWAAAPMIIPRVHRWRTRHG